MRGSGRFSSLPRPPYGGRGVSIPFIAGQWSLLLDFLMHGRITGPFQSPSLRGSGRFDKELWEDLEGDIRFNPLHCGAVVASFSGKPCHPSSMPRFNPLHCGAVVASYNRFTGAYHHPLVSIPFIAGQWSLHQLESLARLRARVSIPFIAGQWSLLKGKEVNHGNRQDVSIPFIAGQWSLLMRLQRRGVCTFWFQSPSLRGSGRFENNYSSPSRTNTFQSPSLRGSGRFTESTIFKIVGELLFQSPSLRGSGRFGLCCN